MNIRLCGLLILGLLLRLGYGWHCAYATPPGVIPDPDGYAMLASSLASGGGLSEQGIPSAHREPGYPVLLAVFFKIFGAHYWTVLLLNAILGTGAVFLILLAGKRLFDEKIAWAAAIIAVFYPPFIFYAAQTLREVMMSALAVGSILALCKALDVPNPLNFALAGAINALCALTNTTFLPFGLLMVPAGFFLQRHKIPSARINTAIYIAVFAALYALWPIRNYLQLKTWVVGSTAGAASTFYTYLIVPQEIGGTPEQVAIAAKDPVMQEGNRLGRIEQEHFFWKAGMDWVRHHPVSYMKLVAWRLADFWRLYPRNRNYEYSYSMLKWISLLTDGWIIPLAFIGIFLTRLRRVETAFPYLQIGSVYFIYALIFTTLRYRVALMPWMILFAAAALKEGWNRCLRNA